MCRKATFVDTKLSILLKSLEILLYTPHYQPPLAQSTPWLELLVGLCPGVAGVLVLVRHLRLEAAVLGRDVAHLLVPPVIQGHLGNIQCSY